MPLTLMLPPRVAARVRERAGRLGIEPAEYVAGLVDRDEPPTPPTPLPDAGEYDDPDAADVPPGWPDDLSRLSPAQRARLEALLLEGLEGEATRVTPTGFADRFRERQAALPKANGGEARP